MLTVGSGVSAGITTGAGFSVGGTAAIGTLSPEPPPTDTEITMAITAMTIAPNPPNKSQLGIPPVRPLPAPDPAGCLGDCGGLGGGVDRPPPEGVLPNATSNASAISPDDAYLDP